MIIQYLICERGFRENNLPPDTFLVIFNYVGYIRIKGIAPAFTCIIPSVIFYVIVYIKEICTIKRYALIIFQINIEILNRKFYLCSNTGICPTVDFCRAILNVSHISITRFQRNSPAFYYIINNLTPVSIGQFIHTLIDIFYVFPIKCHYTYIRVKGHQFKFLSKAISKRFDLGHRPLVPIVFSVSDINFFHCININYCHSNNEVSYMTFISYSRCLDSNQEPSFGVVLKNRSRENLIGKFNGNEAIGFYPIVFIKDSFIMVEFFLSVTYNKLRVTERVCNISHCMDKLLVVTTKAHVKGVCAFKNISRPVSFIICIYLSCYVNTMHFIYTIMFPFMDKKTFDSNSYTLFNLGVINEIRKIYLSHCKTLLVCNSNSSNFPIVGKKPLFIFISKRLFLSSMFLAINFYCKMIKRNVEINVTPLSFAVVEALFSFMVNMRFIKQLLKVRFCRTMFIKEFPFPLYELRVNAFEPFNLFFTEVFCVKFKIHKLRLYNETKFLTSHKGIPTLSPQLYIERVKGEILSFCVFTYSSFILNILVRPSSKSSHLITCIEGCPLASLSNRLLASRLSPSSSVGGTLRGLAPEGRIYQIEQFYISAKTTEEDLRGLNLVCMGIKIPCKSHWWRTGPNAGYILTLFQKVFYLYPFISPSSYSPQWTIALQRYSEYPNPARNVNSELTFGRACSELRCRKIAAMRKSLCHNTLCANSLRVEGCKFVVLNVVGSSPTGHPTIKPVGYQIVSGYFCTQNRPNPP